MWSQGGITSLEHPCGFAAFPVNPAHGGCVRGTRGQGGAVTPQGFPLPLLVLSSCISPTSLSSPSLFPGISGFRSFGHPGISPRHKHISGHLWQFCLFLPALSAHSFSLSSFPMLPPCLHPISCQPHHSREPGFLSSSPSLHASILSVLNALPWDWADICCTKFSPADPPSSLPVGKQLCLSGSRLPPGEIHVQLPCNGSSGFSRVWPEPQEQKLMFSGNEIPTPVPILTGVCSRSLHNDSRSCLGKVVDAASTHRILSWDGILSVGADSGRGKSSFSFKSLLADISLPLWPCLGGFPTLHPKFLFCSFLSGQSPSLGLCPLLLLQWQCQPDASLSDLTLLDVAGDFVMAAGAVILLS